MCLVFSSIFLLIFLSFLFPFLLVFFLFMFPFSAYLSLVSRRNKRMPFTPVLTSRIDTCDKLVGISTVQRNALAASLTSPGHPPEAFGLLGDIDCWS